MLDLNDVRVFTVVARKGTFSAAGRELRLPTSTVARATTRLEEHLKVLLLRRSPRGVSLTEAGTEFLVSCDQALLTIRIATETLHERRTNPCGLIRVCCPVVLANNALVPMLPEFLQRYPDIRVVIETYTDDFDRGPREDVDVFFKIVPPRDSVRRMRKFPTTLRGLFASTEYVQRAGSPYVPEELLAHACIGAGTWRLANESAEVLDVTPAFRVTTCDPVVMCGLVLRGLGIAILPLYMARQPEMCPRLVPIMPQWHPRPAVVSALYFGPSALAPKIKVFLDFFGEVLGTERDPRVKQATFDGLFGKPHET
jgi:DNA-binding transcriptional LysR family regulator